MHEMGKITLKGMRFYGFHGVLPVEQEFGQYFEVDAQLFFYMGKAGDTDDLADTVDYSELYRRLKYVFYEKRYKLLEALAQKMADEMLLISPIKRVVISIRKPHVPLDGDLEYAELRIERERP
ncbi:MAG: dihydroneopterin aldolase [Clostridia bacterium]|nr:dihydroneopterin aldolase [Clostridia bacterium]